MIVFIGGGNMATALIGGLVARGHAAARDFRVVEPDAGAARRGSSRALPGRRRVRGSRRGGDRARATLVVLAVKPQQMRDGRARARAACCASPGPVVLTIAAGIRLADLSRWLGGYARLVRAMPNTPALVGKGISGVYAPAGVDARRARAREPACSRRPATVLWVEREAMLDAVTGVSGSGPAYVFYFLEALEAAARELGFAPADARRLAYATFAGAIALAQASRPSRRQCCARR